MSAWLVARGNKDTRSNARRKIAEMRQENAAEKMPRTILRSFCILPYHAFKNKHPQWFSRTITTITHRSYLSAGDIPRTPQKTGKGDRRGRTGRFRDPVLATALCPNAGVSTDSESPRPPASVPFSVPKKTLTYGDGYNRMEKYIRKNSTGSSQQQRCDSINTMMETSGII